MLIVNKLLPAGKGLARALVRQAASVELDWDVRQKSRFDAIDSAGRTLGVFLARGMAVRGGDVLVAEDGSLVRVVARPQPVMTVTACREHGSPFDLLRAAYHLGNRHVPLQLEPDRLAFEPDPVLAALLRRMHLIVTEEDAPFEPEAGAYAAAGAHGGSAATGPDADGQGRAHRPHRGHDHAGHGHGHGHDHSHDHADHDHEHEHEHEHGHGHGHGHRPAPDHGPAPQHDPAPGPEHDPAHPHRSASAHEGEVDAPTASTRGDPSPGRLD